MSEPRFTVFATNYSPNSGEISRDLNRRPLGKIDDAALAELLGKFSAAAIGCDDTCDPHLTVAGRIGTFAIRPATSTVVLAYDVTDASRNFVKLEIANVAAFLDYGPSCLPPETPAQPLTETITVEAPPPKPRSNLKPAFAALGALAGLTTLTVSAQFSFMPEPLDSDVTYAAAPAPADASRMRAAAAGEYLPKVSTRCNLTINSDGTIRYVVREIDGSVASDRVVTSELAMLPNQLAVLRTTIGPVEIRDADTVVFAGETFVRKR